jgi:hypothetical protein
MKICLFGHKADYNYNAGSSSFSPLVSALSLSSGPTFPGWRGLGDRYEVEKILGKGEVPYFLL